MNEDYNIGFCGIYTYFSQGDEICIFDPGNNCYMWGIVGNWTGDTVYFSEYHGISYFDIDQITGEKLDVVTDIRHNTSGSSYNDLTDGVNFIRVSCK